MLAIIPGREKFLASIRKFDQSVPRVSAVRLFGDAYVIVKRTATGNINKLYLRHGLNREDKLLVDPVDVKLIAPNQAKGQCPPWGFAFAGRQIHGRRHVRLRVALRN